MIEIEAAQEILVGLAAARMLRGHKAWYKLEQITTALQRAALDLFLPNAAFRCGYRFAHQVGTPADDVDLVKRQRDSLFVGENCRRAQRKQPGTRGC